VVIVDEKRMKTIIVLEESARVIAKLNGSVFAIMSFLVSSVTDNDEEDLAKWVAFYAKKMFDKKYGAGAADQATEILLKRKPQSVQEFIRIMEDFMDDR